jgi:single-stranded-DNA-specific exonuclease
MQQPAPETRQRPLVLGVERSASGKRWEYRGQSARQAEFLAQRLGVSATLGAILEARQIDPDYAPHFLEPRLRELMPDPSRLRDMDAAADLLAQALIAEHKIALFGDYDVDGMSSTAMLRKALLDFGSAPLVYLPDRQTEGYGPNVAAMEHLAEQGSKLLITIDCGVSAFEALERAKALGMQVLVLDHHKADALLPAHDALVNPNRLDDESGLGYLCAGGVVFLFLVALQRRLKALDFFQGDRRPLDLRNALDLAALATVCDVVPLVGLNRVLVKQGLAVLAQRENLGLNALLDCSRLHEAINASTLGFQLGPRLNAAGRIGNAGLGLELLTTTDGARAQTIAQQLDRQNDERKALEAAMIEQAEAQVAGQSGRFLVAQHEDWHEGVIGIVAGRLKERYHRPALVLTWNGDLAKGSARSIPGFDLGALVLQAKHRGMLESGGGHAMAAGLSVTRAKLPEFLAFAEDKMSALSDELLVPRLGVDAVIGLSSVSMRLIDEVGQAAPFGQANPEPRFALSALTIEHLAPVGAGKEHFRLRLSQAGQRFKLKAMAFRAAGTPSGQVLQAAARSGLPLAVAGHLRADNWSGPQAVQLLLDDVAEP